MSEEAERAIDANSVEKEIAKDDETTKQIESACRVVINLRKRPLIVLYYPVPYSDMSEEDVRYCYAALRSGGIKTENPLKECDVLIHTYGGSPVAAYKLAQVIHDFCINVSCLIPEYAYSAGTLLCFAGNEIRFGHFAGLSPIDITQENVELASIDNYIEFAGACQKAVQKVIDKLNQSNNITGVPQIASVGSDLLCHLVEQVGALDIGRYYRARTLAGHYAEELLDRYMFAGKPNAKGRRNKVISNLLFQAPSHQFHLDYHMGSNLGLVISEMSTDESDATKSVISTLNQFAYSGVICQNITDDKKMPFIAFYA